MPPPAHQESSPTKGKENVREKLVFTFTDSTPFLNKARAAAFQNNPDLELKVVETPLRETQEYWDTLAKRANIHTPLLIEDLTNVAQTSTTTKPTTTITSIPYALPTSIKSAPALAPATTATTTVSYVPKTMKKRTDDYQWYQEMKNRYNNYLEESKKEDAEFYDSLAKEYEIERHRLKSLQQNDLKMEKLRKFMNQLQSETSVQQTISSPEFIEEEECGPLVDESNYSANSDIDHFPEEIPEEEFESVEDVESLNSSEEVESTEQAKVHTPENSDEVIDILSESEPEENDEQQQHNSGQYIHPNPRMSDFDYMQPKYQLHMKEPLEYDDEGESEEANENDEEPSDDEEEEEVNEQEDDEEGQEEEFSDEDQYNYFATNNHASDQSVNMLSSEDAAEDEHGQFEESDHSVELETDDIPQSYHSRPPMNSFSYSNKPSLIGSTIPKPINTDDGVINLESEEDSEEEESESEEVDGESGSEQSVAESGEDDNEEEVEPIDPMLLSEHVSEHGSYSEASTGSSSEEEELEAHEEQNVSPIVSETESIEEEIEQEVYNSDKEKAGAHHEQVQIEQGYDDIASAEAVAVLAAMSNNDWMEIAMIAQQQQDQQHEQHQPLEPQIINEEISSPHRAASTSFYGDEVEDTVLSSNQTGYIVVKPESVSESEVDEREDEIVTEAVSPQDNTAEQYDDEVDDSGVEKTTVIVVKPEIEDDTGDNNQNEEETTNYVSFTTAIDKTFSASPVSSPNQKPPTPEPPKLNPSLLDILNQSINIHNLKSAGSEDIDTLSKAIPNTSPLPPFTLETQDREKDQASNSAESLPIIQEAKDSQKQPVISTLNTIVPPIGEISDIAAESSMIDTNQSASAEDSLDNEAYATALLNETNMGSFANSSSIIANQTVYLDEDEPVDPVDHESVDSSSDSKSSEDAELEESDDAEIVYADQNDELDVSSEDSEDDAGLAIVDDDESVLESESELEKIMEENFDDDFEDTESIQDEVIQAAIEENPYESGPEDIEGDDGSIVRKRKISEVDEEPQNTDEEVPAKSSTFKRLKSLFFGWMPTSKDNRDSGNQMLATHDEEEKEESGLIKVSSSIESPERSVSSGQISVHEESEIELDNISLDEAIENSEIDVIVVDITSESEEESIVDSIRADEHDDDDSEVSIVDIDTDAIEAAAQSSPQDAESDEEFEKKVPGVRESVNKFASGVMMDMTVNDSAMSHETSVSDHEPRSGIIGAAEDFASDAMMDITLKQSNQDTDQSAAAEEIVDTDNESEEREAGEKSLSVNSTPSYKSKVANSLKSIPAKKPISAVAMLKLLRERELESNLSTVDADSEIYKEIVKTGQQSEDNNESIAAESFGDEENHSDSRTLPSVNSPLSPSSSDDEPESELEENLSATEANTRSPTNDLSVTENQETTEHLSGIENSTELHFESLADQPIVFEEKEELSGDESTKMELKSAGNLEIRRPGVLQTIKNFASSAMMNITTSESTPETEVVDQLKLENTKNILEDLPDNSLEDIDTKSSEQPLTSEVIKEEARDVERSSESSNESEHELVGNEFQTSEDPSEDPSESEDEAQQIEDPAAKPTVIEVVESMADQVMFDFTAVQSDTETEAVNANSTEGNVNSAESEYLEARDELTEESIDNAVDGSASELLASEDILDNQQRIVRRPFGGIALDFASDAMMDITTNEATPEREQPSADKFKNVALFEELVEERVEETIEETIEETVEEPVEEPAEEPVEEPVEELVATEDTLDLQPQIVRRPLGGIALDFASDAMMDITTNEATPEGEQSSTVNSTNVALSEEPVEEPVEEKEKVDLEERLEVTPSFDAVSASTVLDTATTEEQNSEDPVVASYKPSFSNIASSFASSVLMDLDASEVEEGDPNVDESKEESLSTSKSEEDVYEEQSINEPKLEEKIDIVVNSIPSNEELNAVDDEDLVTRISVGPTEKDAAVIDSASDDVIDETISISVQPEETSTVPPGLLSYLLAKASHSRQSDGAKETIDDKLPQNESETEETEMIHVKSDDAEAEIDENASDSSVIYKQNDLLQAPDSLGKIPALQLQQSESSDSDDESEQEIANNALVKTDSSPARRTRSQIAENALPEAKKRSLEDLEEDLDLQNHREVRKGSNKRINSDSFDLGRKGRTKSPVRKDKSYRAPSPIKITGSGISTRSGRVLSYEFDEAQLNLEENTISVPAQPDDRADDTKDIELETLPKSVQELVAEGEQFIEVEEEFEAKKEHEHELELYEEEIEEREQMGDENINEHEKSVAHITVKPETNEKQGSVQENDEKLKVESTIQEPIEQITVKKRGSRIKAPSNAKTSFRAKMRETSTESELPLSETEGPRTRRKRVVSERSRNRLENERVPSERATRSSKAVESDEPKQEDEPATKRKRARERERVGRPPKRRGRSSK